MGDETYRRVDDIRSREVGQRTYLIDPRHNRIHELNVVGAAVWNYLAEPASIRELVDTFRAAFPEVGSQRIERDIRELLAELVEADLISKSR